MKWWTRDEPKPKQYVVEVPKASVPADNEETISQVASLQGHPGFRWLLQKLDLQAARLRSELANKQHSSLRDVEFLQSGIQWCDWLRGQLDFAKQRYQNMREATLTEQRLFEEITSSIELVGHNPTSS